ncbi:MAG: hypothetical protein JWN14_1128 [Chthonomonadales bacterium]|nr:hypothetical protein [Chthonomonadales bacterium]
MAAFASNFMRQKRGVRSEQHEPSYWLELVDDSIDDSGLWSGGGSRDFTTEYLRRIAVELRQAQRTNTQPQGLSIETSMFDWLSCACEDWVEPFKDENVTMALSRLRIDAETLSPTDCAYEAVAILEGSQELPPVGSYADVALVISEYLRCYVLNAPNNWNVLFSPLILNR